MTKSVKKGQKAYGQQSPDCAASTSMTIETENGTEQVNINMGTGEISYGPNACEMADAKKKATMPDATAEDTTDA